MTADAIVWISGATQGLGAALARNVPYENARVVNISRRMHPELETVQVDFTRPDDWAVLAEHFTAELDAFEGERALFIHNASYPSARRFAGEIDPDDQRATALANVAAPLVAADAFVRACRPGYESGLVLVSSAAARIPLEGDAVYGAGKAAVEQWVRTVRLERARRGTGPWVVAVRPGFVDTPASRHAATLDPHDYPASDSVRTALSQGDYLTADAAAAEIWAALPPDADTPLLLFGAMP
jgi:short-subunit dehydrogenase